MARAVSALPCSLLWILTCFHSKERLPGKVKLKSGKCLCQWNLKIQKVLSLIHLFWLNSVQYVYFISLWKSSLWILCHFGSEFNVVLGSSASLRVLANQLLRVVTWWLQGQFRLYHFDLRPQASTQKANYVWFVRRCWLHAESWSELSRQRIYNDVSAAKSNLSAQRALGFFCVFNFLDIQFRQGWIETKLLISTTLRVKYWFIFFCKSPPTYVCVHLMRLYKYLVMYEIHMQVAQTVEAPKLFFHSYWPNMLLF